MTTTQKVIVVIVLTVVSGAIGRFTAPTKVKIETKTVEVIKEVKVSNEMKVKNKKKTVTTVTDTKPDGSKHETTTVTEGVVSSTNETVNDTKDGSISTTTSKEVTKASGRTNLSLLGGVSRDNSGLLSPTYGVGVMRNILGPITIGVWGLTTGVLGASVGIDL